ncbi:MAG TPA: ABC transporter ATP-binding protein [Longimicrobiaceae bacterium]|nr:ABC transporter ATP-binding protein [Longimicrobiaceae bacterium]
MNLNIRRGASEEIGAAARDRSGTVNGSVKVEDLSVTFRSAAGPVEALSQVSLSIDRGEVLGVVGESGSGKSTLGRAMMGLTRSSLDVEVTGSVMLAGTDMVSAPSGVLRRLRGDSVAMIFQDSGSALNPVIRVGEQIEEAIKAHHVRVARSERARMVASLLQRVGIEDYARVAGSYPHQLSGGMRQRALIAEAIANRPSLLIADEPTTALDVITQKKVLDTLQGIQSQSGCSLVIISHDLGVISRLADRVAVMYAGRVVEIGERSSFFDRPRHPYSVGLLRSVPRLGGTRGMQAAIPGTPTEGVDLPAGCRFHPRCPLATEICRKEVPPLQQISGGGQVACHHYITEPAQASMLFVSGDDADAAHPDTDSRRPVGAPAAGLTPVPTMSSSASTAGPGPDLAVRINAVTKSYKAGRRKHFVAVKNVSLDVPRGTTVGVVGESGSGKSTLARCVAGLLVPDSGKIVVAPSAGRLPHLTGEEARKRPVGMVFQDPYGSVDPFWTVEQIVREGIPRKSVAWQNARQRIRECLDMVGLGGTYLGRYPRELSGGQRQRVGIARALASNPEILVLDEPTAALDVSIQAQVLGLLSRLQTDLNLTYIFISHDISLVSQVANQVAVMRAGSVVEVGPPDGVFTHPRNDYTRALIHAVPMLPGQQQVALD